MRTKKFLFYGLAALLAGCGPIFSLHPLFTSEDIVFDEKLLGTWADDPNDPDSTWEFARLDEAGVGTLAEEYRDDLKRFYRLNVTNKEDDKIQKGALVACLVKLQGGLFLDVFSDRFPSGEQDAEAVKLLFNAFFFVPVHTFLKVDLAGDRLTLRMTDDEQLEKLLEAEPKAVEFTVLDDRPVLTASTKELQSFVVKYAGDERLFPGEVVLNRRTK